ncbi:MAG: hypothetical protein Q4B99_01555 [Clostridia bacterium]|nr:hypothetical protein [Clostridia bacterium]
MNELIYLLRRKSCQKPKRRRADRNAAVIALVACIVAGLIVMLVAPVWLLIAIIGILAAVCIALRR